MNIRRIGGPILLALLFLGTSFGMAAAEKESKDSSATTATTEKEVRQEGAKPSGQAQKRPEKKAVTKEAVDAAIKKAQTDLDAYKKKLASGDDTAAHPRTQKRMEQFLQRTEQMLDKAVKHREQGELETAMSMAERASGGLERMKRVEKDMDMRMRERQKQIDKRPDPANPRGANRQPSEQTNPENSEGGKR